jgi:hypothetical protein
LVKTGTVKSEVREREREAAANDQKAEALDKDWIYKVKSDRNRERERGRDAAGNDQGAEALD